MKITLTKLIGDICYKVFGVQANIHVIHAIQSAVLHKLQSDNPILDKYQEEESKELITATTEKVKTRRVYYTRWKKTVINKLFSKLSGEYPIILEIYSTGRIPAVLINNRAMIPMSMTYNNLSNTDKDMVTKYAKLEIKNHSVIHDEWQINQC